METTWTPERIEELGRKLDKHIAAKNYAKKIADDIWGLNQLNKQVREAYDDPNFSYEELEIMWKMQERMEKSITMKVKHFFKMVYDGENSFTKNLKGKSYLEHYFDFKDFVESPIYNIKVA